MKTSQKANRHKIAEVLSQINVVYNEILSYMYRSNNAYLLQSMCRQKHAPIQYAGRG